MARVTRRFLESSPPGSQLKAHWKFDSHDRGKVRDLTGNGHDLKAFGNPVFACGADDAPFVHLDGRWQWLETKGPVLDTTKSHSVAVWCRLDKLVLDPDCGAYSALSQRSGTHTPFYLGVRSYMELQENGAIEPVCRWCLNAATNDGSGDGFIRWQKAWSSRPVDQDKIGEWTLLVSTCDVERGLFQIVLPTLNDRGEAVATPDWDFWPAEQAFQVGRAQYFSQNIDYWPGDIAEAYAWEGVLTDDEIAALAAARPGAPRSAPASQRVPEPAE